MIYISHSYLNISFKIQYAGNSAHNILKHMKYIYAHINLSINDNNIRNF